LTPLVMFLLSLSGGRIEVATSVYVLFGYVVLLYVLLAALSFCAPGIHQCYAEQLGVPRRHAHALGYTSVLQAAVVTWLFWLAATHLFDHADLEAGERAQPALTTALFAASAASVLCTYVPRARPYLAAATHAFVLLFLVRLALPTCDWMPQSRSWSSIARVGLFFAITLVLDISTRTDEVSEGGVERDVDPTATDRSSRLFCVTMAHATLLVYADGLRTRRIVAQSAWVLVTSGWQLVLFGVALALVAYLVQPTVYVAPPPTLPVRIVTSAAASDPSLAATEAPLGVQRDSPPPRPSDAFAVVAYRWQ